MYEEYIKHINPKEGYYIKYFESQFPNIMDRARGILKDRTHNYGASFGITPLKTMAMKQGLRSIALKWSSTILKKGQPPVTSPSTFPKISMALVWTVTFTAMKPHHLRNVCEFVCEFGHPPGAFASFNKSVAHRSDRSPDQKHVRISGMEEVPEPTPGTPVQINDGAGTVPELGRPGANPEGNLIEGVWNGRHLEFCQ